MDPVPFAGRGRAERRGFRGLRAGRRGQQHGRRAAGQGERHAAERGKPESRVLVSAGSTLSRSRHRAPDRKVPVEPEGETALPLGVFMTPWDALSLREVRILCVALRLRSGAGSGCAAVRKCRSAPPHLQVCVFLYRYPAQSIEPVLKSRSETPHVLSGPFFLLHRLPQPSPHGALIVHPSAIILPDLPHVQVRAASAAKAKARARANRSRAVRSG